MGVDRSEKKKGPEKKERKEGFQDDPPWMCQMELKKMIFPDL